MVLGFNLLYSNTANRQKISTNLETQISAVILSLYFNYANSISYAGRPMSFVKVSVEHYCCNYEILCSLLVYSSTKHVYQCFK